ncbi:MAG: ClpXP protease specificity-enhancing factor [Pseudomonadota bacterium]
MTSSRPYLLHGLHAWITDNHLTPYILVDAGYEGVLVPRQFVDNGKIILNVSQFAVRELDINGETLEFDARFSGKAWHIFVPIAAVLAIYAKENGQGMVFTPDGETVSPPSGDGPQPPPAPGGGKPKLKLVK